MATIRALLVSKFGRLVRGLCAPGKRPPLNRSRLSVTPLEDRSQPSLFNLGSVGGPVILGTNLTGTTAVAAAALGGSDPWVKQGELNLQTGVWAYAQTQIADQGGPATGLTVVDVDATSAGITSVLSIPNYRIAGGVQATGIVSSNGGSISSWVESRYADSVYPGGYLQPWSGAVGVVGDTGKLWQFNPDPAADYAANLPSTLFGGSYPIRFATGEGAAVNGSRSEVVYVRTYTADGQPNHYGRLQLSGTPLAGNVSLNGALEFFRTDPGWNVYDIHGSGAYAVGSEWDGNTTYRTAVYKNDTAGVVGSVAGEFDTGSGGIIVVKRPTTGADYGLDVWAVATDVNGNNATLKQVSTSLVLGQFLDTVHPQSYSVNSMVVTKDTVSFSVTLDIDGNQWRNYVVTVDSNQFSNWTNSGGTAWHNPYAVSPPPVVPPVVPPTVPPVVPPTVPPVVPPTVPPPAVYNPGSVFAIGNIGGVDVFDGDTQHKIAWLNPFPGKIHASPRTATGDFDGDGISDLAVGEGPGGGSWVFVYSGASGFKDVMWSTDMFGAFSGGLFLETGDVDGDLRADLAATPDEGGGPRVRVFSGGKGFAQIADFFGIADPNFRGGARAAIGDLNGDAHSELVVAAGFGGGPRMAVFDGAELTVGRQTRLISDFFAFDPSLRNGVFPAAGDLNGDGVAELIAGAGPGGGPRVTAWDGKTIATTGGLTPVANFFAGPSESRYGVQPSIRNFPIGQNVPGFDLVAVARSLPVSTVSLYKGMLLINAGQPAPFDQLNLGANVEEFFPYVG